MRRRLVADMSRWQVRGPRRSAPASIISATIGRNRGRELEAQRERSKPASTAPLCSACCRPAARAMRSTARSGTSKRSAKAREVWKLAGLPSIRRWSRRSRSAPTIPRSWPTARERFAQARALKMKLTGDLDLDIARVRAVRAARPDVWLGVDANQGYGIDALDKLMPRPGRRARLAARAADPPRPRSRSRRLSLADSDRRRRERALPCRRARRGEALQCHQHQARQVRRPDRSARDGARCAPARAWRHGRQHGRHEPRDGAAFVVGQLCDIVDLDGPVFLATIASPASRTRTARSGADADVWGSRQAVAA